MWWMALENAKAGGKRIVCAGNGSVFSHQLTVDVIDKLCKDWDSQLGGPVVLVLEGMKYFGVVNEKNPGSFGEAMEYKIAEESVMGHVVSVNLCMEKLGSPL